MKKFLRYALAIVLLLYFLATFIVSPILDKQMNLVEYSDPRQLGAEAKELYRSLEFIADLHCDALLWDRDLTKKLDYAHLDFPRMQQANMSLQAFTIVTKSPKGQNFKQNSADAFDKITMLNFVQGRLPDKWFGLYKRAEYQARALQDYQKKFAGKFLLVKSRQDLKNLIKLKKTDPEVIGGFLGIEGAHCLEGNLDNVQNLYYEGVRMMAPTHFFDNELGGSAHGISGAGLTDFGREVIHEMNRLGIIIDLAHVSPKMIDEILDQTTRPVLVSHTGVKGTKDSPRNISDRHINRIAASGGLIGIGFFRGAIKGEIKHIVEAMKYVRDLVGIEHVALGSDFDGAATTPIDVTGLPFIVQELMNQGFSEMEIRAVMGENVKRFLMEQLP
ncbi:dipeptidase [Arenibacter echinorum]|uniref:Microsomal dipeptidase-like Zn-dependent dipeptidase n=1 Tax=Arenibacter echinorum TaxID=440515 RepID=A0A327R1D0_9FLAO|nr:dipeptidase [Arenibacter echinorum]RAJ10065.1 microsomal dipeptidase-like Zn-dependent dipeptidase [Arenibacter echinorum]